MTFPWKTVSCNLTVVDVDRDQKVSLTSLNSHWHHSGIGAQFHAILETEGLAVATASEWPG